MNRETRLYIYTPDTQNIRAIINALSRFDREHLIVKIVDRYSPDNDIVDDCDICIIYNFIYNGIDAEQMSNNTDEKIFWYEDNIRRIVYHDGRRISSLTVKEILKGWLL